MNVKLYLISRLNKKYIMKYIILILFTAFTGIATAQSLQGTQQQRTVVMNATIHRGNGTVIENGIMAFDNGRLTLVADATVVRFDMEGYTVINANGKHVYPGLIALNSQLGLKEIEQVRATNDVYEVGNMNPNVRAVIAYNTDSRVIPTVRENGILMAQIVPGGGTIHGSSSVVSLDAWNWEDAVIAMDNAIHMSWPSAFRYSWSDGGYQLKANDNYGKQVNAIRSFFEEALAYQQRDNTYAPNLKLAAMRELFTGEKKLFVEAETAREIMAAIAFAESMDIQLVILGGAEAHIVKEELASKGIPVVLSSTHKLPLRTDDPVDLPYRLPAILQEAGVLCAISVSNDGSSYWNMRNLPYQAGTSATYGLSPEDALSMVTRNAAIIVGIDSITGFLDEGMAATFLIAEQDLFDMAGSNIISAYLNGVEVTSENWQEDLYHRFREKYGLEE